MHLTTSSLLLLLSTTQACMHYTATLPFSNTIPFEASIQDNKITTCWISTTYAEHKALQMAVLQQQKTEVRGKIGKRSNGRHVKMTALEGLKDDGREGGSVKGYTMLDDEELKARRMTYGQRTFQDVPRDHKEAGFLPWEFECLQGYKARANVGARTVTYVAHGQEFYFIPKEREDVEGGRFTYEMRLWCGKPQKNGMIAP